MSSIGACAFYGNALITDMVVPKTVTSIGWAAFGGCDSLANLTVPFIGGSESATVAYNTTLGHFFGDNDPDDSGCNNSSYSYTTSQSDGKTSQAPESGSYCYYFVIPESLRSVTVTVQTDIPDYAFKNCDLLESVTLPSGATYNENAFNNCSAEIKNN